MGATRESNWSGGIFGASCATAPAIGGLGHANRTPSAGAISIAQVRATKCRMKFLEPDGTILAFILNLSCDSLQPFNAARRAGAYTLRLPQSSLYGETLRTSNCQN